MALPVDGEVLALKGELLGGDLCGDVLWGDEREAERSFDPPEPGGGAG